MANRVEQEGEAETVPVEGPPAQPKDGAATRLSIAFYISLILLTGQFVALLAGDPVNYLLLAITGATWLGILFGPANMIEFFRAIRGNSRQPRGDDDGS
jgi:hypothetical protein